MSRALAVGIVAMTLGASAGLVGLATTGCSGKVAPTADASTSSSTSSSSSSGGSSSWGGSTSSSSSTGGSSSGCITTDPIDTSSYPWKPPHIALGSCTNAELASFDAYVTANPSSTDADWKTKAGMSASCVACVFGEDGATWAPLVESSGILTELDVGGCIEIASGDEACGKAYQQWIDCRFQACANCNANAEYSQCEAAASKTACRKANDLVISTCGSSRIADYEAKCATGSIVFDGPIHAQCIDGLAPPDGGLAPLDGG